MARMPADIRSLCRAYTDTTVRIVATIAQNSADENVRLRAIHMLWERGWGRPDTDEGDGSNSITITIRNVLREKHLTIEHEPTSGDT